ncbi:MAG: hypothetical protein K0S68_558 [Candidatus Saccharibacteria bacterium]|jgi:hypothetical protein|nr:hypothetical protein [Candidatus Saccharibacteria bacterium]
MMYVAVERRTRDAKCIADLRYAILLISGQCPELPYFLIA